MRTFSGASPLGGPPVANGFQGIDLARAFRAAADFRAQQEAIRNAQLQRQQLTEQARAQQAEALRQAQARDLLGAGDVSGAMQIAPILTQKFLQDQSKLQESQLGVAETQLGIQEKGLGLQEKQRSGDLARARASQKLADMVLQGTIAPERALQIAEQQNLPGLAEALGVQQPVEGPPDLTGVQQQLETSSATAEALSPPDESLKQANIVTAAVRAGLDPRDPSTLNDPRFLEEFTKITNPRSLVQINTGEKGQEIDKVTRRKITEELRSNQNAMDTLLQVKRNFNPDLLVGTTKARIGVEKLFEKTFGLTITEKGRVLIRQQKNFERNIAKFVNDILKAGGGKQLTETEIQRFIKETFNEDMSITEFQAAFDGMLTDVEVRLQAQRQILNEGNIEGLPEVEVREMVDRRASQLSAQRQADRIAPEPEERPRTEVPPRGRLTPQQFGAEVQRLRDDGVQDAEILKRMKGRVSKRVLNRLRGQIEKKKILEKTAQSADTALRAL